MGIPQRVYTCTHTHTQYGQEEEGRGEMDGRNLLEECISFGGLAHAGLIGSVYWNVEPSADGREDGSRHLTSAPLTLL